jgi:cytoplasmic iron level regulating protein YaaA (DUF328/UPF0246 family)
MQNDKLEVDEHTHKEFQERTRELLNEVRAMTPENRRVLMETIKAASELTENRSEGND